MNTPRKGLTIGNFDGVHLGHQFILKTLRDRIDLNGILAVFTFSNHPSEVFGKPITSIYSTERKLELLKEYGANHIFIHQFTTDFAAITYDEFLTNLHANFAFSELVLGKGARLGKNREGTEERVARLGEQLGFNAIYVPKRSLNGEEVSSTRIRMLIQEGNFTKASQFLGRSWNQL